MKRFCSLRILKLQAAQESQDVFAGLAESLAVVLEVIQKVKMPKGMVKTITSAWQVIANMAGVFKLPLPPGALRILNGLSIFQVTRIRVDVQPAFCEWHEHPPPYSQIDLATLVPFACLFERGFNFHRQLLFTTLWPLALFLGLGAVGGLLRYCPAAVTCFKHYRTRIKVRTRLIIDSERHTFSPCVVCCLLRWY